MNAGTVPPLLELHEVTVRASGATILDVPRIALEEAGTLAVLGPNGAGKSTLLRVAGALLAPATGCVLLDGAPSSRRELRGVVAAVLQRPLLRHGTVRANVETGLRFRRVPRRAARARAEEWLQRLGIAALADRSATTLSGGEAQRVSLARALAVGPRLLLLDEPFSALDAPTRGELLADLREALADTGTAALLVTHDRHEAAALARQLAVLHAGALRQLGPTATVLDHPADRDCARTLGFDNVLEPALAALLLGPGAHETALRAEDCWVEDVVAPPAPPNSVRVRATLRRVVPLGPVSRVLADVDGHPVQATAPAPPPPWLARRAPGDPVVLRVEPARARPVGPTAPRSAAQLAV
jgi:ABC-type sulfate/molybdate transport systems ATPase subunit